MVKNVKRCQKNNMLQKLPIVTSRGVARPVKSPELGSGGNDALLVLRVAPAGGFMKIMSA